MDAEALVFLIPGRFAAFDLDIVTIRILQAWHKDFRLAPAPS